MEGAVAVLVDDLNVMARNTRIDHDQVIIGLASDADPALDVDGLSRLVVREHGQRRPTLTLPWCRPGRLRPLALRLVLPLVLAERDRLGGDPELAARELRIGRERDPRRVRERPLTLASRVPDEDLELLNELGFEL